MTEADWNDSSLDAVAMELRMASGTPSYAETEKAIFAVFNRGAARNWVLPAPPAGTGWDWRVDDGRPGRMPRRVDGEHARSRPIPSSVFVLGELE